MAKVYARIHPAVQRPVSMQKTMRGGDPEDDK